MHAKPHRQNSDFQLRHFLVGDCKTPDGAYVLMYGQQTDMQDKLRHAEVQLKRREAKLAKCQYVIDNPKSLTHEVMEAEADKMEAEADIPTWTMNHEAAKAELDTIQKLMLELRPKCRHAHLPILEMAEACQQEEWLLELKCRAENYLLTQGYIPADHFQTMRMHPQFKEEIVPHLHTLRTKMDRIGKGADYGIGAPPGPESLAALMIELNKPLLLGE